MRICAPLPIRILSHNIRYATDAPFKGEEAWEIRRPHLVNELCFNTAYCAESIVCLQEVLHRQLMDILAGLNSKKKAWDFVGVGRDDGIQAGEYSPILYRPGVWELKSHCTKWLSETPDRPSRSWDAACRRILTIAVFQHHSTRKTLVAMNTHLDDQGERSRLEATRIIREQIRITAEQSPQQRSAPVFLAGDFNSEPNQEAYKEISSEASPMGDLQLMVPGIKRYGDLNTFTGFDIASTRPKRIDFIFINKNDPTSNDRSKLEGDIVEEKWWLVDGYAVLPNRFDNGVFISDHRIVVGDLSLI